MSNAENMRVEAVAELKEEIARLTDAVKKVTSERDFALKMKNQMRAKLDESREATARKCVAICEEVVNEYAKKHLSHGCFIDHNIAEGANVCADAIRAELLGGGK